MPISKPFPSLEPNGFTLIEMLVVLTIFSLAAILFIGSTSGSNGIDKRKAVQELEQKIVLVRQKAMSRSTAQAVVLDGADIHFQPAIGNDENLIFYADGSSNGGSYQDKDRTLLKIRWIDGALSQ